MPHFPARTAFYQAYMKSQYNEGTTISSPPFEAEFVKKSAYSVSDKSLTAKRSLLLLFSLVCIDQWILVILVFRFEQQLTIKLNLSFLMRTRCCKKFGLCIEFCKQTFFKRKTYISEMFLQYYKYVLRLSI
ncbi:Hypothetical_protein [Hexamita inflata]|uniref:Hypothetical_protein n=1 Tax=Hexamita inflata TaxID=28002 RepID=A0ABP1J6N9_9EUKA